VLVRPRALGAEDLFEREVRRVVERLVFAQASSL
jgi:hypothetical protein